MKRLFEGHIFLYLNGVVVLIGAFLITRLLTHRAATPPLLTIIPLGFWIYIFLWVGIFGVYLFVILRLGEKGRAYVFIATLFIFGMLEIVANIMVDPLPDNTTFRYPRPYVMFTQRPNSSFYGPITKRHGNGPQEAEMRFNDLGVRVETPLPKEKPADEYRVFVLGGSTVVNGIPLINSIPGQLQDLWKQAGNRTVKVYNFGVTGYVSDQELAMLTHYVLDYNPDLVVAYDGGNDLIERYSDDPRPGFPLNFILYEVAADRVSNVSPVQMLDSLLYKSRAVRILFGDVFLEDILDLNQLRKSVGYGSLEWEKAIAETYLKNQKKMCRVANAFGARYIAFLQPMAHFKSPLSEKEKGFLGSIEFQSYIRRGYDHIRSGIAELEHSESPGCTFVDLSVIFERRSQETYIDMIHVDDDGNKIVAQGIYGGIKKSIPTSH